MCNEVGNLFALFLAELHCWIPDVLIVAVFRCLEIPWARGTENASHSLRKETEQPRALVRKMFPIYNLKGIQAALNF